MLSKRFTSVKKILRKLKRIKVNKRAVSRLLKKSKQLFLLRLRGFHPTVLLYSIKQKILFLRPKIKRGVFIKGAFLLILGTALLSLPQIQSITTKIIQRNKEPKINQPKIETETKPNLLPKTEPIKISKDLTKSLDTLGEEIPYRIIIPRLGIDLPIVEAKVIDGFWEVSETSASFGLGSAFPGDVGNTVIFAHAREPLFGPLRKIKENDKIYILTKKHHFSFSASEIKNIYPNQVEFVGPSTDERLTLFTCSGFLDSQRLLVIAKRND